MVHRHIEEPLDLPRMEIHRQHPISAGSADEIGHELR